jgi:hypothetical protein
MARQQVSGGRELLKVVIVDVENETDEKLNEKT